MFSQETEQWLTRLSEYQNADLHHQMIEYSNMLWSRTYHRWYKGCIVQPRSPEENRRTMEIVDALTACSAVLLHLKRGVGGWCPGCKSGSVYHERILNQGACILGLK